MIEVIEIVEGKAEDQSVIQQRKQVGLLVEGPMPSVGSTVSFSGAWFKVVKSHCNGGMEKLDNHEVRLRIYRGTLELKRIRPPKPAPDQEHH